MKRSELKMLIKEIVSEVLNTEWDMNQHEIDVDGQVYRVNAKFRWAEEAVDYRFDQGRGQGGQGQDLTAEVPQEVEEIEAIDANDNLVQDPTLLEKIKEAVLDEMTNSEEGMRNQRWGQWM